MLFEREYNCFAFVILILSLFIGCGGDSDTEVETPVNFISATPPGAEIAANATISITFDNTPTDVTVNVGSVTVVGKTAVVSGPFPPGPITLTITWADGTQTLNYVATTPCCDPPLVIGGTVRDGDTNIKAKQLNAHRIIEIVFSIEVTGTIKLETQDGTDVGWIGTVKGVYGRLEHVKGRDIQNATTYRIVGKVSDVAGNPLQLKIRFTTEAKP